MEGPEQRLQICIREMIDADTPELASIMAQAQQWAEYTSPLQENDLGAFLMGIEGETVFVAEADGKLLGFGSVYDRNFLHHLYVLPSHHRTGVGSELLRACTSVLDGKGTLKCLKRSDQAVQFYLSNGWQVIGEDEGPEGPYLIFSLDKALFS